MNNETIVIYHGGCRDGFCAAWVVNKYFSRSIITNPHTEGEWVPKNLGIHYHPGYYGQEPPDCKDKNVIIVDFAYDINTMTKIYTSASSLIWLDHHKTAEPIAIMFSRLTDGIEAGILKFQYTIDKSGAGIAWDYFFPNQARPWLVDYVEDRDLWLHKLEASEQVNAYIACLEFDFTVWNNVSKYPVEAIQQYGTVAKMKTEQYVREVCKNVYFVDISKPQTEIELHLAEYWPNIPTVNICQVDCSEVLHQLCISYPSSPFSLYWFKRQDGMYQYGLRSIGDFDVSAVAKLFGGGGHKNAAGFQLKYLLEELK